MAPFGWVDRVDTRVLKRRLLLTVGGALGGAALAYGIALLGSTVGVGMLLVTMLGAALFYLYLRSTTPSVSASIREDGGVGKYLDAEFTPARNPERLLFLALGLLLAGGIGMAASLSMS